MALLEVPVARAEIWSQTEKPASQLCEEGNSVTYALRASLPSCVWGSQMPVCPQGSFPWPVRLESGEPGERGSPPESGEPPGERGARLFLALKEGSQPGPAASVGNKTVRGGGPASVPPPSLRFLSKWM